MKPIITTLMSLSLVSLSFAMDQMTIGVSRVLEEPTSDSQEIILNRKGTEEIVHVDRNIVLSDKDFTEMSMVEEDGVAIMVTLTEEGTKKFADLTKEMMGKRLAIHANNRLISAPVIKQQINGGAIQISGNLTRKEAEELIAQFQKSKDGNQL